MKKTWVRKTLSVGIMAAGALLLGPVAAAQAGGHHTAPQGGQNGITQVSSTNLGALNGTQFAMPVTAPMNMNGNALALGGISSATGGGVNHIAEGPRPAAAATGSRSSPAATSASGTAPRSPCRSPFRRT